MPSAQVRAPEKIIAPIEAHLARRGQFGSVEKNVIQERAPDVGQTLSALKAQNAALIVQNCALKAALIRQARVTGPQTGDLHCDGVAVPTLSSGVPRRLVAVRTAGQTARHVMTHSETGLVELTPRQTQILHLVLAGQPSKNIAADLNISQRTVENHRAAIMRRTGATSLPALARMAVGAADSADQRSINSCHSINGN